MSESPSQWTALLNSNLGLSLKTLRRGVQVFLDGLQSSIILFFFLFVFTINPYKSLVLKRGTVCSFHLYRGGPQGKQWNLRLPAFTNLRKLSAENFQRTLSSLVVSESQNRDGRYRIENSTLASLLVHTFFTYPFLLKVNYLESLHSNRPCFLLLPV